MLRSMRTTLTLDPDVAARLRRTHGSLDDVAEVQEVAEGERFR